MAARSSRSAPVLPRSLQELQARQAAGDLRVLTAAAFRSLVARDGLEQAYHHCDVVVASETVLSDQGALQLSLGLSDPPIRLRELQLGGVGAQVCGASADLLLPLGGALQDPARRSGAQVLDDLLAGRELPLAALGEPTTLQPRAELSGRVTLAAFGVARLLLHRAVVENGIVAVSSADGLLRTPLGPVLGPLASALYSSSGAGSIGLTMPALAQLGPGSPLLVAGGLGWVIGAGSGHNPAVQRLSGGQACAPGAVAAVAVDLEQVDPTALRSCYLEGHGAAVLVALAAPVLLLDPGVAAQAAAGPAELQAPVLDLAVPRRVKPQLASVSYDQLQSGKLQLAGQSLRCAPAHSPRLAAEAAQVLVERLCNGRFPLQLPSSGLSPRPTLFPLDL